MNTARSLPSREAWIEIINTESVRRPQLSLPSREAWIEISMLKSFTISAYRRFPRGKRGLKYIIK